MNSDTVRLWDPLVRFCHWSLVLAFVGAYFFTEEGDDWHSWLGYYAAAVVLARGLWGFVGTPAARWADFWPTLSRLKWHLRALVSGESYHRLGHSPVGALVMVLMLALMFGLAVSGFLLEEVDYFWGDERVRDVHQYMANSLLALVCVHICAALFESVRLKENLPLSMITGRRRRR